MTFQQDEQTTPVLFRKFKGGDVIALFPTLPGNMELRTCASFMHVGQHGAADVGVIFDSDPAKPSEYAELKQELESAPYGYRLKVYQRSQRAFTEIRRAALSI